MESFFSTPASAAEFAQTTQADLEIARAEFNALISAENFSTEQILHKYNLLFLCIERVAAQSHLFENVHPDAALREAAEKNSQEVSKLITEISLSKKLFSIFSAIDTKTLDTTTQRLVTHVLRDFRRSGVDKDDATRARITTLQEELVLIGQTFSKNIREDVRSIRVTLAQLDGLPADYVAAHAPSADDGLVTITTDYPDLRPFMRYAHDAASRKELFYKFNNRAYPQNQTVLKSLFEKRFELAQLLGYPHWADFVTEDKMIKNADAVAAFLSDVHDAARVRGHADYEILLAEKRRSEPEATTVAVWESEYWDERVKMRAYNFDSLSVRPYFEYTRVRDGLMKLTSALYNITYTRVETAVWHAAVDVYDISRGDKQLGRIFLDMHPRDDKYKHAAQFTLRSGIANTQLPEGALICNFTDPRTSPGAALLDHDQVTTFFHEFGHLLHHIFGGHTEWLYFSGVATEWDFVEAPSQFFEEWAMDAQVLQLFATHIGTGEPIPAELVARMRAADECGKGLFVTRQLMLAALSLNYYNRDPQTFDPHALAQEMRAKYNADLQADEMFHEYNFGHLDGYSAIYYTYMWSLVIAKDLLSKFEFQGLLDPSTAQEYARTILEPGGTKDAAALIQDFLGRPYSSDAFKKWLTIGV